MQAQSTASMLGNTGLEGQGYSLIRTQALKSNSSSFNPGPDPSQPCDPG